MTNKKRADHKFPKKMVSLFSGIGGFELAFKKVGIQTSMMCEIDVIATHVLNNNFPNIEIVDDVRSISILPSNTDIITAGFPCQDLSSVGVKKGIGGERSSLVSEVFRILKNNPIEWVIFENVSFMLSIGKGETMRLITKELESLGYNWAYRLIDSISFLPQHRNRVYIIASLNHDPRDVILSGESIADYGQMDFDCFSKPIGFYWTEGKYALGLVSNGLPTLKAGSTIGIPSPPAIAFPNGEVSIPDIRDAERLQGFPANWTKHAEEIAKPSVRWRLVGNAVTVDTIEWIAEKILRPAKYDSSNDMPFNDKKSWPKAAWYFNGDKRESKVSIYPINKNTFSLEEFIAFPLKPLSLKASKGFESRLNQGGLHCPDYFKTAICQHIKKLEENG